MSNKTNPRRKGERKTERPSSEASRPHGCAGEGHNGAIGRTNWKVLGRRMERRTGKRTKVYTQKVVVGQCGGTGLPLIRDPGDE